MKIWDYISRKWDEKIKKDWHQIDEKLHEKAREEVQRERKEHEVGRVKRFDEITGRYYNKSDLVCFVQFGKERNEGHIYFMCGYLNNDGTKFKDLLSEEIYDVFDAPYPDRGAPEKESMHSTITVCDRPFAMVNPWLLSGGTTNRWRSIKPDVYGIAMLRDGYDTCVLDNKSWGENFDRSVHLFDLFDKESNGGIMSGEDVLSAIIEGSKECVDEIELYEIKNQQAENIRLAKLRREEQLAEEKARAEAEQLRKTQLLERATLTPEERDF